MASSDDRLPQMNEAIAFDTLRFAKYLAKNGFTEQQAETMAEAQVKFLNVWPPWPPRPTSPIWPPRHRQYGHQGRHRDMATKTDLALVQADTKVEARLIKWMVGVGLALAAMQTTLIVGLLS